MSRKSGYTPEKGDRISSMFGLDALEVIDECVERRVPAYRFEPAGVVAKKRRRRAVRCREDAQRFPTLRTGHAEIDRVV